MRTVVGFVALALVAGCNGSKSGAPAPVDTAGGGDVTYPTPPGADMAMQPAAVVFTAVRAEGGHAIHAVAEDGSHAALLSREGADTTFVAAMPGRRVALAVRAADGSLASLETVRTDGTARAQLGALTAGRWARVVSAKADGDVLAVELARTDDPATSDIVIARPGAAPALVGAGATLVALASGRVAFNASGAAASVKLDGSGRVALGADDAKDHVVEVRGDRLLLTLHDGASGDVRIEKIDGSARVDLGTADADDKAFGFAGDDRVVVTHDHAVAVVGVDGKGERVLAVEGAPLVISPAGDVLFTDQAGVLHAASLTGAVRTLDGAAGVHTQLAKVVGDRVFFAGGPNGNTLRAARLDGGGAVVLCDEPTWRPFFSTVTSDGRAVFYRALVGQLEGGRLYSVKLDGSDLSPMGDTVHNPDGTPFTTPLADQDFEAVTPSGRVVFEAEFQETASHLLISEGGQAARRLFDRDDLKFAALVVN